MSARLDRARDYAAWKAFNALAGPPEDLLAARVEMTNLAELHEYLGLLQAHFDGIPSRHLVKIMQRDN